MSANWVCFDCRHIARLGYPEAARCPRCQQPLQVLSTRLRLPRRADKRAWDRLQEAIYARRREARRQVFYARVRQIHQREKAATVNFLQASNAENRHQQRRLQRQSLEPRAPRASQP